MQACFQEHRTISKTGFTRTTVIELFNPVMLAVHLRTAGLRPPQPPHFFKLYKATSSIMLPAKNRTHMALFRTCDKDVVCANGGGCDSPLFLYAVQICFQEHRTINQNCFKIHHAGRWGGYIPPNSRAFLICARSLQVSSCQLRQNPICTLSEPVIKNIYDGPE